MGAWGRQGKWLAGGFVALVIVAFATDGGTEGSEAATPATTQTVTATVTDTATTTATATTTVTEAATETVTTEASSGPLADGGRQASVAPVPLAGNPGPAAQDPARRGAGTVPTAPAAGAYYAHCADARSRGAAPLYRGQPGYRSGLDRDGDGIACER